MITCIYKYHLLTIMKHVEHIPVNIITGSLGAGKTTLILNLLNQLPKDYKVLWLKNEYGDVNIDSELGKLRNIQTTEILNGCLCCVLVGKLGNALEDIRDNYKIDRLFIETAGTAYPFPIVNEVNKIKEFRIDSLVKVVDCLNFEKIEDKTALARSQSKYIDLIVLNKQEEVEAAKVDHVEDEMYDLYPNVPIVKSIKGSLSKDLVLGVDSKNRIIETGDEKTHYHDDYESFSISTEKDLDIEKLSEIMKSLNSSDFHRIKGIINIDDNRAILLNYVLGRINLQEIKRIDTLSKINFIGKGISNLEQKIKARILEI